MLSMELWDFHCIDNLNPTFRVEALLIFKEAKNLKKTYQETVKIKACTFNNCNNYNVHHNI